METMRDRLGSFSLVQWAAKRVEAQIRRSYKKRRINRVPKVFSLHELSSLCKRIKKGNFVFSTLKPLEIPKPGKPGSYRGLLIPKHIDRVVHKALYKLLKPKLLEKASSFSYGISKKKGIQFALTDVRKEIGKGNQYLLVCDIKDFFNQINRKKLKEMIIDAMPDRSLDKIVQSLLTIHFLEQPKDAKLFPSEEYGIPQGSALSPVFSDIFLKDFDERMRASGYSVFRYIDDFAIAGKNWKKLYGGYRLAKKILKKKDLDLYELNSKKCKVIHVSRGAKFLGIEYHSNNILKPDHEKFFAFKRKVGQQIVYMADAKIRDEVIKRFNSTVLGWSNAYKLCAKEVLKPYFSELNVLVRNGLSALVVKRKISDDEVYAIADSLLVFSWAVNKTIKKRF